jgi:TonB family protein
LAVLWFTLECCFSRQCEGDLVIFLAARREARQISCTRAASLRQGRSLRISFVLSYIPQHSAVDLNSDNRKFRMNSFIAVTTLISFSLFLNNQSAQLSLEKQAVAGTQRILASELDAELPSLPFTDWFGRVVGPGTGMIWQLSECGDRLEASPEATGDARACVEVNTILSDGRKVILMIAVGTFKKGMIGSPAFHFGVVERKGNLYPIRRLRDLQQLLSAPERLANKPAVNLPEASLPTMRLEANNEPVAGGMIWSGGEFGRLVPDEEPPPVEPAPTRPAPSNPTSNAETRNASSGVIQGAPKFKPQPKYPQNARRFNASGMVEVRVTISVTGRVTRAVAISGHPLLRDAAVEAARRWEFEPTMVDGNPVETELVLTFDFAAPPPS